MPPVIDDLAAAYAELGLPPSASERDVKIAWRRLVSQWHPDRNADANAVARLQRLNAAFELLRSRSAGDAPIPEPEPDAEPSPPTAEPPAEASPAGAAAEDGSEDGAAADSPRRAQRTLKLDLEAAALGCTRTLRGQWRPACMSCHGRGHRRKATPCPHCEGRGRVASGGWFGWMATMQDCAACSGAGKRHEACPACDGRGTGAAVRWQVTARIPAGVRDGDRLRVQLPGAHAGPGPRPSELLLRIALQPHPFLALHEDGELHCEVPVDGYAWVAERPLTVPIPGGVETIALRREQRHYRLEGHGFPRSRRGPRGDLHVHVLPLFAERLSEDQQILLEQLLAAARGPHADRIAKYQRRLQAWARQDRKPAPA